MHIYRTPAYCNKAPGTLKAQAFSGALYAKRHTSTIIVKPVIIIIDLQTIPALSAFQLKHSE